MLLARLLSSAAVCAALAVSSAAQKSTSVTLTDLHDLNGSTDGVFLYAPVMQASDGNYYGVTASGGSQLTEAGTIFRIVPGTPDTFSVVHTFDDAEGQGALGLTEGADGNLYGASSSGGTGGNGAFFKFNLATSAVTVLYSFGTESSGPSRLTLGSDGNFYAATTYGGNGANGSLIQITPSGTTTLLYSFTGPEGENPVASVTETASGTFYGTSQQSTQEDAGSVYKMVVTTSGSTSTAVVSEAGHFDGIDGQAPNSALVEYSDGKLYGTSRAGDGFGNFYSFVPSSGTLTNLYDFATDTTDTGMLPNPPLLASDGNFYMATNQSVQSDAYGSFVQATSAGSVTTLFDGNVNRSTSPLQYPSSPMIQGSDGNVYATSSSGGSANAGNIFEVVFSPALAAPIQLTASTTTPEINVPFTLTYSVKDAFSLTSQQCWAYVQGNPAGAGSWTGREVGALSGNAWTGSVSLTPTVAGTYTYALTCGGVQSGFLKLTVGSGTGSAASSTSVVSINSPLYQGMINISVSVSSASNTGPAPTGSVAVMAGSVTLGSITLTAGSGSTSTGSLAVTDSLLPGTHSLSLNYGGDSTYKPSSAGANLIVQFLTPSLAPSASPDPATVGQDVSLLGQVSGSGPVPTGTVAFTFSGTKLGSAAVKGNGVATFGPISSQGIPPGTYALTAQYSGDSIYSASAAVGFNETLNQGKTATTTTVTAKPNPVSAGQNTTIVATVAGSGTPTGSVALQYNSTTLTTANLSGGKATFVISDPDAGAYKLTFVYSGDASHLGSSSAPLTLTITKAVTSTTIAVSPTSVPSGGNATFTATVSSPGVRPTGTVSFISGGVTYGPFALTAKGTNTATANYPISTQGLAPAEYGIKAVYNGDSENLTSTSGNVNLTVTPAAKVTISATPNPVTIGQNVTITITVAPNGYSGPTPTGSVKLLLDGVNYGTLPLVNGVARVTQSTTGYPAGTYTLMANYFGDSTYPAAATTGDYTVTLVAGQ